ncbi:hypothetical protein OHA88_13260 [Streptomyces sp. NBC_00353]|uniref:hypothetical protein n=1 Tax=Streptomyces sp. NBC_00353 TaxID=2975722 RepID=UPI002E2760DE
MAVQDQAEFIRPVERTIRGSHDGRQRVASDCGQFKYLIAQPEADVHARGVAGVVSAHDNTL